MADDNPSRRHRRQFIQQCKGLKKLRSFLRRDRCIFSRSKTIGPVVYLKSHTKSGIQCICMYFLLFIVADIIIYNVVKTVILN